MLPLQGGTGLIPGWETKISHTMQHSQNKNKIIIEQGKVQGLHFKIYLPQDFQEFGKFPKTW